MGIRAVVVVAAVVAFSALATTAHATPIIDQQCCGSAHYDLFTFDPDLTRVQTFTAGMAGLMTGIDLGIETPVGGSLPNFELFAGAFPAGKDVSTFGVPLKNLSLADTGVSVPSSGFTGDYFFSSLGAGIPVAVGQQFSVVMLPGGSISSGWLSASGYGGGTALTTIHLFPGTSTTLTDESPFDFAFRTYVDSSAAPVPEPMSMVLVGTGLIGISARRWRNRCQRG